MIQKCACLYCTEGRGAPCANKEPTALERELRLDEERIADQMTADELRGITAPNY